MTPSVRYYTCPGAGQPCQESRDFSGAPTYQGNENKADCDAACLSSGKTSTAGTNTTSTPSTPPTPTPCTDPQKCTGAGGIPCDGDKGIKTAIGCIPTEPTALIQGFLKFATGIGGAIALLLMIAGSFQMIASAGNPETVKKGQEQFTNAIIGLLFIIFSVLLLKVIGVDILQIPGLKP